MQPRDVQRELEEHGGFVQSLARSLVRDQAQAADVTQATWLAALQGKAPESNARAWLAQVLRRTARRHYARHAGRLHREAQAGLQRAAQLESSSTDEIVARQETLRHVTDAVLALDEPYRSTVILRFHGNLEASEIAAQQGIPVATVRSRLQRALAHLRTALDSSYGDRQSWCLALISLGRLDPAVFFSAAAVPAGQAGALAGGAWMLGWNAKGWLAAMILVACGGFWWMQRTAGHGSGPEPDSPTAAAMQASSETAALPPQDPAAPLGLRASAPAPRVQRGPQAAPSAPPSPFGSVVVTATWASRQAATSTWIELENPFASPSERVRRARTDDSGRCVFGDVVPGRVQLRGERGGTASLEVFAGEHHTLDLVLPTGLLVRGTVVDDQGTAIPGADLRLYGPSSHARGIVVAQSGPDGEFSLRDVEASYRLGAMASGLAPSPQIDLAGVDWDALGARGLVLTLESAAGSARIQVEDHRGQPLPGALISLTLPSPAHRTKGRAPSPQYPGLRTGPDGLLSLPSLPVGIVLLRVTAQGYAPQASSLSIQADASTSQTLRLVRAAKAQGRVTSAAGAPLAGIWVQPFLPYEDLYPVARTDAEGRYTLDDLPVGSLILQASDPAGAWASQAKSFAVDAGATLTWNPVMVAGRSVFGAVTGRSGSHIAERSLRIRLEGDTYPFAFTQSGPDGSFQFSDCPPGPLAVDLFDEHGIGSFLVQTQTLAPGDNGAWFDVSAEAQCGGQLQLRLAEGGTAALRWVSRPSGAETLGGTRVETPSPDGDIAFHALCPGTYDLELRQDGFPTRHERGIVLREGQHLDLGTFERGPLGSLEILVDGKPASSSPAYLSILVLRSHEPQAPPADPLLALAGPRAEPALSVNLQEDASRLPLAPGHYLVRANGNTGIASQTAAVTIEAGAHTRLDLVSAPGQLLSLECRPPSADSRAARVAATLVSGQGPAYVQELEWNAAEGTFAMYDQVRPGTYTFAFQAVGQEPATAVVAVTPEGLPGPGQSLIQGPGFQILRIVVAMP